MSYDGGTGTEQDPYLIGDEDQLVYLLNNDMRSGSYFKATRSLDMAGKTHTCSGDGWSSSAAPATAKVDLDGHIVSHWGDQFNVADAAYLSSHYLFPCAGARNATLLTGWFRNGRFECNIDIGGATLRLCHIKTSLLDCHVVLNGDAQYAISGDGPDNYAEVLSARNLYEFVNGADGPLVGDQGLGVGVMERFMSATCSYYAEANTNFQHGTQIAAGTTWPAGLTGPFWRAIPGRTPLPFGLGQHLKHHIAGTLYVDGAPAERTIKVLSAELQPLAETQSDPSTGAYALEFTNYTQRPVYVAGLDPTGRYVEEDTDYAVGDLIHPPVDQGYRYRCTVAGDSGDTIPATPWATTADVVIGGATFTPELILENTLAGPLTPLDADEV